LVYLANGVGGDVPGPQLENGYTQLANELIEALALTSLSPKQSRCVWFLIRMTYGWGKKDAEISSQEWMDGTGLDKSHIYKAVRQLMSRNMVARNGHKYSLNKHHTQWREVARTRHRKSGGQFTPPISGQNTPQSGPKVVARTRHPTYKENLVKEKRKGVARSGHQKQEGRVQAKSHQVPPCEGCGFQYAVGYEGMKDGVCLDCRQ
jgi:phage replication O-like protein O